MMVVRTVDSSSESLSTRLLLPAVLPAIAKCNITRLIIIVFIGITHFIAHTINGSELALRSIKDKGPPRLSPPHPSTDRQLMEGDTLRLACPFVAVPRAIVTWEKDAVTVRPLAWERHYLTPDGLLTVRYLEVNDSGSYVCRATNGFGTVEFRFQVKILTHPTGVPQFTEPFMANLNVSDGSTAIFRCHVRSNSHPNIQWLKRVDATDENRFLSNSSIYVDGRMFIVLQRGPVHAQDLVSGSYVSKFTIQSASVDDCGMYICVATNSDGFSTYTAFLQIIPRQRGDSMNVGMSFEYSSPLWVLPFVTSIVLVLIFGLALTVTFVYLRRRRNQSTKMTLADDDDVTACGGGRLEKNQDQDASLVYPVPGIVISTGFPEEEEEEDELVVQLAEQHPHLPHPHHPGCGTGSVMVERCRCVENHHCGGHLQWHDERKNWTTMHDRRSMLRNSTSRHSFYLFASTTGKGGGGGGGGCGGGGMRSQEMG